VKDIDKWEIFGGRNSNRPQRPSIKIYGSKLSADPEHVNKVKAVPRQNT